MIRYQNSYIIQLCKQSRPGHFNVSGQHINLHYSLRRDKWRCHDVVQYHVMHASLIGGILV
jgi:hypothetical protein